MSDRNEHGDRKVCRICNVEKDIASCFYKAYGCKTYRSECKDCRKQYMRNYIHGKPKGDPKGKGIDEPKKDVPKNEQSYYYKSNIINPHAECIPHSFRALIVGPSGSGKTSLLMRLLLEDDMLNYDKLYVFAKSLYQPEYQVLKAGLSNNIPKNMITKVMGCDIYFK